MSVRISLTLEASEMFMSLCMVFSLERTAIVWAILDRISGFDPSLEMIAPRFLKFFTSSSLWPFILISLWKPFGLFVITFVVSGPISILYLVVVVSRRSIRTPASSSSSGFTTMSSAKRKLVISRPPMLTLPSWWSNSSHMILPRKVLKRVGESRHSCRTPTVVLTDHSPVLPLNRSALWALSYRFSMAGMMLALMLYFLIIAHKASCPDKGLLEVYEDMAEILLMLQAFLTEDPEIEYLFCGVPSGSETCLLFCNELFRLWLESV